jgi:hypothetical protein
MAGACSSTPDRASHKRSMTQSARPAQKPAGASNVSIDLPSDALRLGVDSEGATHHYSRIAGTVAVVETDGGVHRTDLEEQLLETWIDYVADERGWETLRYVDSFVELFDRLEVA